MKIDKISKVAVACLVLFTVSGCDDADYQSIENRLYINEAVSDGKFTHQTETLTVTGNTTTSITVRLARPIDRDVHVTLGVAPEYAETYNTEHAVSYEVLPEQYLSFAAETTIKAGQVGSSPVKIEIGDFSSDVGVSYCIPLGIVSSDAPVATTKTTSHILYLLESPLLQHVPEMEMNTVPEGKGDWGISTTEWTLEGWIWMSAFNINNQAFWNGEVSKGTEIYCRFGDAAVDYDRMQIKTGGSEMESKTKFSPNTWYHVAITYSSNTLSLYVNGSLDNSKTIVVAEYIINNLKLCSSGGYWQCVGRQAQVRFWKKALTGGAIAATMNRAVPADSEGLFGYWKLDEGQGKVFYDSTSNGFDLTCYIAPTWSTERVNFSSPNN